MFSFFSADVNPSLTTDDAVDECYDWKNADYQAIVNRMQSENWDWIFQRCFNTRTAKYPLYLQQPRASNDALAPAVRLSHSYRPAAAAAFSHLVTDTAGMLLDALTPSGLQRS